MSRFVGRVAAVGSPSIVAIAEPATGRQAAAGPERPGGVYAAFATRHDYRVVRLTAHFDRLLDSAARLGFRLAFDGRLVRRELCTILETIGTPGARIRISVHPDDVIAGDPTPLQVAIEPYSGPPLELRARGVSCLSAPQAVRANPRAKQTSWLADRSGLPGAPYEWLLLDEQGRFLEGASSNFYAIVGGELRTAGDGVLPGVARSIVLEVAAGTLPVRLDPASRDDVSAMSEAFISSASRGIVPVVEIDRVSVGDGRPGNITRSLISRYDERADELEEPLCGDDGSDPVL